MQAHHTLPFGGDLNLCRAYMPFKCVHYLTGEPYCFDTVEERKRWEELKGGAPEGLHWEKALEQGWSAWVLPETGETWIPTDVHGQTTTKALEIIKDMQGKDFKWWRNIGKRFNFMRNYGGGDFKAAETLEIPLEHAKAMNKGYSDAFPLVLSYQEDRSQTMMLQGYVENMFGRRYYISSSSKFYKVANYDIQGPSADMLKEKMIEIDKYIEDNNLKIRMSLCVHDELQFARNGQDEETWYKSLAAFKAIMEDTPMVLVPIVAEVEETRSNWASKSKVVGL